MDYFDILLARNLANKGDITTESLNVTENGTYTAPSGKAYSPVTVEVQPPANSYQLKSMTTPTSLATFEASEMPMPTLKASIKAQQASGTPSPSNPLPISGWTEAKIYDDAAYGGIINFNQLRNSYRVSGSYNGVTFTNNENSISLSGSITDLPSNKIFILTNQNIEFVRDGRKYIFIFNKPIPVRAMVAGYTDFANAGSYGGFFTKDTGGSWINCIAFYVAVGDNITISDLTVNVFDLTQMFGATKADEIYAMEQAQAGSGVAYFKSLFPNENYAYNAGTDMCVSEANGDTSKYRKVTISLGQTVYGGEVDVVNGILKITDGYIASYNGETLPSTWISSMDVYAEGTSPTTGAEVCYELATPITIPLTPSLIKSLNGINNLSVDCGDVIEGEYFKAL